MACPVLSTSLEAIAAFPPRQGQQLVEVVHRVPEVFGIERSRWRLDDLRRAIPWLSTYSLAGISRALTRLGVSRKRGRFSVYSPEPAYRNKLERVEGALDRAREEPQRVSVLYGDEFTLFRQPSLGAVYAQAGVQNQRRSSRTKRTLATG